MGICFSTTKINGLTTSTSSVSGGATASETKQNHPDGMHDGGGCNANLHVKKDHNGNHQRQKHDHFYNHHKAKIRSTPKRPKRVIPCGKRTDFGYRKDFNERYTTGKLLGHGQFGYTYAAVDKANGDRVAVKKIDKNKMVLPIAVEDVKREVKILQELSGHENVVKFYNAFEDDSFVYIVMELCEGGELLDRILSKFAKDIPWKMKDSRILEILQAIDSNTDGLVDFTEFVAATLHVHQLEEHNNEKWLKMSKAAFQKLDVDKNGYITPEELKMHMGLRGSIYPLLEEADMDKDGKISLSDFRRLLRSASMS